VVRQTRHVAYQVVQLSLSVKVAQTVGGELNKLAANVSIGREACGVHYRSDGVEGMRLGEAMALSILRDLATCYHEQFPGFSLTRFDGTPVTICPDC